MASSLDFVKFIADQMSGAGEITYRKMFGEYGLYLNGKFFAMVCDDRLFFKPTAQAEKLYPGLEKAPPYEGAKDCILVEDVDNRELIEKLAVITYAGLPEPKAR
ncbi:MAG: TfoX/Sxy family protein [Acutalibacteraceae bacterium]